MAQFGPHGRVVIASTPLAADGLFAELHQRAKNGEIPGAVAFLATTAEMNPAIDEEFLRAQEVALGPDDFRREYLAEFLSGGAAFIENEKLRDAVEDYIELMPADGRGWICGLDPGFASDPFALTVVGRDIHNPEGLVVARAQRWLPARGGGKRKRLRRTRDEETEAIGRVLDEVAEIVKVYGGRCLSDQHLPGTIQHELSKRGVHVVSISAWTAQSKTAAFQALRARINTRRIRIPNEPQLITEISRLRTKYRSGSATVEAPRVGDSHCDMATALALTVFEHDRHGAGTGQAALTLRAGDSHGSFTDRTKPPAEPAPSGDDFGRSGRAPAGLRWHSRSRQTNHGMLSKVF